MDRHAPAYPSHRRADPRITARIHAALGDARTVLNVGAGSGSYEPRDRYVLAVEPSAGMHAQRPADLAPAIIASAEALPIDDAFDAAMAIITLHHWSDAVAGLRELRRVAGCWMISDYLSEALADDRERFPTIAVIAGILGDAGVEDILIPADCGDGFFEAHYARLGGVPRPRPAGRPIRLAAPAKGVEQRALTATPSRDLASGAWDARHGHLRTQPTTAVAAPGRIRLMATHRRSAQRLFTMAYARRWPQRAGHQRGMGLADPLRAARNPFIQANLNRSPRYSELSAKRGEVPRTQAQRSEGRWGSAWVVSPVFADFRWSRPPQIPRSGTSLPPQIPRRRVG